MTGALAAPGPIAAGGWTLSSETALRVLLFLMMGLGSISFIEPSPYEVIFLALMPLVFLGHFVLTRATLALAILLVVFVGAEWLALMPWLGERPAPGPENSAQSATAFVYTAQTTYLFLSALMFAVVFTRSSERRLDIALRGYTLSCVIAAAWAVAGWLDLPGFHDKAAIVNRIAGPFKDPNVLGSYCILGVLHLMQAAMRGGLLRRLATSGVLLFTIFGGICLPLSRGAFGALAFAVASFALVAFVTARERGTRRAILVGAVLLALAGVGGGLAVASDPALRDVVTSRVKLEQDYDGGVTGRFGNQKRSIPMLMERPLGFGPHRFAFYFDLDPHDSYIGAFASTGWIGGIAFLLLVIWTTIVGVRLSVLDTPFMRHAQVVTPALVSAFLQALQIDIDHWRFIYFMIGAVWGMEAARLAIARRLDAGRPSPPLAGVVRP